MASRSFDGAYGQGPAEEGHGGSTFCAVATATLLGRAAELPGAERTAAWCLARCQGGYCGRPGKLADTCYSWWCGAALELLVRAGVAGVEGPGAAPAGAVEAFSLACQSAWGGFAKRPEVHPDPYHSFMALQGLALLGRCGLSPVEPSLNISERAWKRLQATRKA